MSDTEAEGRTGGCKDGRLIVANGIISAATILPDQMLAVFPRTTRGL